MYSVDIAHQSAMQQAFYRQLAERCRPDDTAERPLPRVVGLETEYLIVDANGQLIPESVRNDLLQMLPHSSPELGVSTLETHTEPVSVADTGEYLLQELRRVEQETIATVDSKDCRLVRIGSYPGAFRDLLVTQHPPRYQQLMDLVCQLHNDETTGLQIGTIRLPRKCSDIMSGCQSIHINMQIPAGQQAIQMLNKAIELTPYLVALGANSPLMDCRPSGFQDFRIPLWEPLFTFPGLDAQSGVDTRRTGLPDYYYRSWDDYWRDVSSKLFFSHNEDSALDSNLKIFWRTVRLKPCPGQATDCLLEIRALSTQPTLEEDAACYLLICALLHDAAWSTRPRLPIDYVKVNLDQASRYGLDAQLYYLNNVDEIVQQPASHIVAHLLDEAVAIWNQTSPATAEMVAVLRRRLTPHPETPATASLRLYEQAVQAGQTPEEAAHRVLLSSILET